MEGGWGGGEYGGKNELSRICILTCLRKPLLFCKTARTDHNIKLQIRYFVLKCPATF